MSAIAETLEALRTLHEVDAEAAKHQRQHKAARARLATLDDTLHAIEDDLAQVTSELAERRAEVRATQRQVDEKGAALERARGKMDLVQNQKQYSAASVELDLVRRDIRVLEDRALEVLQKADELEARRRELSERLEATRLDLLPKREEAVAEVERIEAELAAQRDQRAQAAERVEARTLELYDRIRASRSDVAMAALTEDGACGHCFTAVTIQQRLEVNTLSRIIRCEGCGVILYPASESE
ncbi:MAG: zinc ribbon domain-containing protein [Gemmatimonadota bacterium]